MNVANLMQFRTETHRKEHALLPPLTVLLRKLSWFVYVVRLGDQYDEGHRDWIVNEMKARGIAVGRYFAPIHLQPIYRSCNTQKFALPITEFQVSRSLALPFFNRIREDQIAEVCRVLTELIQKIGFGLGK